AYSRAETSVTVDNHAADYSVVTRATPEFFDVMGAKAEMGRLLSDEEQRAGGPMTVVVSDRFWRTHMGADASAVGRTLKYADRVFIVVGVLTPEFAFPGDTDVWSAWWMFQETTSRSGHNYRVIGRLKDGVTLAQAQSEMSAIAARLEKAYPTSNEG